VAAEVGDEQTAATIATPHSKVAMRAAIAAGPTLRPSKRASARRELALEHRRGVHNLWKALSRQVLMINFMIMRTFKITRGGQISIPAGIRHRWKTTVVTLEDFDDHVVLRPAVADPIAAARGALAGEVKLSSAELRARAREDERTAEQRPRRA
jgi:bifunctional DNA-binding transcriptional regulator/antitoxin component of YhaV-PrlF toxin-antitoxin module